MNVKLLKAIRAIVNVRRSPLPILESFYIDKEFLWMSNLELTVRVRHHFSFEDDEPILIRSDQFISRIEHIKAPWSISTDKDHDKVIFRSPNSETTFPYLDPAEFNKSGIMQPVPDLKSRFLFNVSAWDIHIMDIARQFAANDELRPVMNAVVIDQEHIVASDAHILYFKKIVKKHEEQVLFDERVVRLMKLMQYQDFFLYTVGKNHCVLSNDLAVWWNILDAKKDNVFDYYISSSHYPNWKSVIPQDIKGVTIIPVKELMEGLKSIHFAVNQASHRVRFKITGNKMSIKGTDLDFGLRAEEDINVITTKGETITFGMKYEFLMKVLQVFKNEGYPQVELNYTDENHAFVMGNQVLIMPMVINEIE
jgi:hypothetical protein